MDMIVFLFMFQYLSLPYIRNIDYISLGKPFFYADNLKKLQKILDNMSVAYI